MKWETYKIPGNVKNAIYCLINNGEIIYIGKTKNGIRRILQHNDKVFDEYSFIETSQEELDYYEDKYIMEYQPKLNKTYSHIRMSLRSGYRKLNYHTKEKYNFEQFKILVKKENINIENFKGLETLLKKDYEKIKLIIEKKENIL